MEKLSANIKQYDDEQIIALPDKNGMIFFEIKKIIRCQSDNSYTDFYISDKSAGKKGSIKIVVSKGFEYFEDILVTKGFFYRIHNRHIINVRHIGRYTKNSGGYLIMDDNADTRIPIARARKESFLSYLKLQGIIL